MFLLLAMGAVITLCVLLWRVAIFALPVFVGFAVGWWAMAVGAGVGSAAIGLAAGVASWVLAVRGVQNGRPTLRILVLLLFGAPAGYAAFEIVWQLSELGVPSDIWRGVLACAAGLAAALTTIARLRGTRPSFDDQRND